MEEEEADRYHSDFLGETSSSDRMVKICCVCETVYLVLGLWVFKRRNHQRQPWGVDGACYPESFPQGNAFVHQQMFLSTCRARCWVLARFGGQHARPGSCPLEACILMGPLLSMKTHFEKC